MSDEENKSFFRKIPGFRSGTWWKMLLAVIGYGFIVLAVLGLLFGGSDQSETSQSSSTPNAGKITAGKTQAPTGVQVQVIYPGKWSGALGYGSNIKTVDGTGSKTFDISDPGYVVSINAQKQDDSSNTLTVQILKNGKVIASESTTAAYGVAMTSSTEV